jgi:hypothetical protein
MKIETKIPKGFRKVRKGCLVMVGDYYACIYEWVKITHPWGADFRVGVDETIIRRIKK